MNSINRRKMLALALHTGTAAAALTMLPAMAGATPLGAATAGAATPDNLPEGLVEKAQVVVVRPRRRRRWVCSWRRGRRVCAWR
jgi:hypothetical protein